MRLYLSKPFFDGHIDRGFPFGGVYLAKNEFEICRAYARTTKFVVKVERM